MSLQNMRGKLVLLDFWEIWCGPCVQSMPKIQANLLGNEHTKSGYKVNAIPEYILIDKEGKVILAQAGFTDDIEKIIKEKLGE